MDLADPIIRTVAVLISIPIIGMGILAIADSRVAKALGQVLLFIFIIGVAGYAIYWLSNIDIPERTPSTEPVFQFSDIIPTIGVVGIVISIIALSLFVFALTISVKPLISTLCVYNRETIVANNLESRAQEKHDDRGTKQQARRTYRDRSGCQTQTPPA